MAGEKAKFALTDFFNNLFNNFGKIVFTNLLFAVPLAVLVTAFYFLDSALKLNGYFILMLSIIPLSPFFAGVTLVTSRLARGKENVDVFKTFIEGIKNNWKRFLIHGVITYFAVIFSYFSIRLYSALISQPNADSFFLVMIYVCLIISIIIAVAFLFIFFYVPSMTVTFDLSLKNIYKNSALMSFGELKHNIIATFGLFVIVLFCATILIFVGNTDSSIALIITTAILMFVLVPALASYVINASVYPGMYNLMTEKEKRSKKIDKKMDNRRKGQFIDEEDEENNIAEEFLDLDVEENKDGDEYIFYNGKMVKRSVIIKMKKEREKAEGQSDEHAEKRPKITISLWLFIAIIAFLVLLIIGITFYSVQRELNSDNKNNNTTIAATEQTTAAETTQAVTEETTEKSIQKTTEESTENEEAAVEPTTQAIVVSGAESADKNLNFDAEMYPYKAFDNVGKRDASVKEVFGSVYGGEGITFDKNGLFSDNITQSEYNYGAYTVTDGVINMTYSNDKNKSAEIISYKGNVPSEIKIDYVGYDVYFKIGSAN